MIISKTHSKNDLLDLILDLQLKVVYSHVDNKHDIHTKLIDILSDKKLQVPFNKSNYYNIKNYNDLKIFLKNKNPKKILSVKEKNDIMKICKHIIRYCKNDFNISTSLYYNDIKDINDDMDYIKQFGDIPSVRRCCRLMNTQRKHIDQYIPIISPQVQKQLDDKEIFKTNHDSKLRIKNGCFKVSFD